MVITRIIPMPQMELLTNKKRTWADRRKPKTISGAPLNNPSILEAKFARLLDDATRDMCDRVKAELLKFFDHPLADDYFKIAMDASISSQAKILTNKLMTKFNSIFADFAVKAAEYQMNAINKASSTAVHMSLKELSGGLSLPTVGFTADMRQILNASTIEIVSLIKSISAQYLGGVQQAVVRSIAGGRGLADLVPYLEKQKGITVRRATMIARDQTRKAMNNLNRGRMQKCGLKKFKWLHSGGSAHPRPLHIRLSGQVFSFDDPPIIDENTGERGIPGQAINCRCRMQPVIDFSDDDE